MLMMIPFWIFSILLTLYGLNVIFCNCQMPCIILYKEKEENTVCTGEFECKKGCENCAGRIFLKHK